MRIEKFMVSLMEQMLENARSQPVWRVLIFYYLCGCVIGIVWLFFLAVMHRLIVGH
jgi:hypothetical protein